MYILKKLNREKKVGTAAEVAVLQAQGWEIVKEVKTESGADIDGISNRLSEKINEQLSEVEKKQWTDPEIEQVETEAEPEEQPEKKTASKTRKKE